MTPLIVRLGKHGWVHRLVAVLNVYPMAELVLRRFPLQRRLRPSGLHYRVTSLDELSTEFEIFVNEVYALALGAGPVGSFIDLGCNAGWFALWLSVRAPGTRFRGLLVDAHPRMVSEAIWHMERNGLSDCIVVHGAVGLPPGQVVTSFQLHPSTSASSVVPYEHGKQLTVKGRITEVTVPAISVAAEWTRLFGYRAVDLLKVDIEGKELDFVRYEGPFLERSVKRIVIEWHKWRVSIEKLDAQLESIQFVRRGILDENELAGLAVYDNANPLSCQ